MNERVTIITLFDEESLDKIYNLVSKTGINLCKVPFRIGVNREDVDTLPYHLTLSSGSILKKEKVLQKMDDFSFSPFSVTINGISMMYGKEDSYGLCFDIEDNAKLRNVQKQIYEILPNSYYNPEIFNFHITIHFDKDFDKVIDLKRKLEENFTPVTLNVKDIGVYSIYPAVLCKKYRGK